MKIAPEIEGLSSSAIRRAVREGRLEEAADMLGHPYTLHGTIEKGNQLGRTIGVPTANLRPVSPEILFPPYGAYISEIEIEGSNDTKNGDAVREKVEAKRYRGVTNIGMRPSIDPALQTPLPTIETHILDFDKDIYGARVSLSLLAALRPEQKFPSLDALKAQIGRDIEAARIWQTPDNKIYNSYNSYTPDNPNKSDNHS